MGVVCLAVTGGAGCGPVARPSDPYRAAKGASLARTISVDVRGRRIYVPIDSFVAEVDGVDVTFTTTTRVREGHPVLDGREHLFREIGADYEVEAATQAPGEVRGG